MRIHRVNKKILAIGNPGLSVISPRGGAAPSEGLLTTLLTDLECYCALGEASGETRSDSYGVEHMTNAGTVGAAAGVDGNNAASFNGVTANYLYRADNPNLRIAGSAATFNIWVKITDDGSSRMVLSKMNTQYDYHLFYYPSINDFRWEVFNGSGTTKIGGVDTTSNISENTWYMLTAYYDPDNSRVGIQLNGGDINWADTTGTAGSSTAQFRLGQWQLNNTFPMIGLLQHLSLYKKILSSAEVTALYGNGTPPAFPYLGGSDLYTTVDTTDSEGDDIRVLVPGNHAVGAVYPVVLYHHGLQETYTAVTADTLKLGVVRNLLGNGYIVAGHSQTNGGWGNDKGTADMLRLYNYINSNYSLSGRVINFSQSAGGICGLLCSTEDYPIPNVKGWFGIYPACDLEWCYANGFSAYIDSAYTITGENPYATATAGHDPILLASSKYTGLRTRFYASASDATVTKVDNTDAMITAIAGETTEEGLVTATGVHGDVSHFRPTDVTKFCSRCV